MSSCCLPVLTLNNQLNQKLNYSDGGYTMARAKLSEAPAMLQQPSKSPCACLPSELSERWHLIKWPKGCYCNVGIHKIFLYNPPHICCVNHVKPEQQLHE